MKKLLMAAVAVASIVATPAMAAAAAQYDVTATVNPVCGAVAGGTITFGTSVTNASGDIAASATAPGTADSTAYCNGFNSTVTVTHTAMALLSPPATLPSNFSTSINFTPVLTSNGLNTPISGDPSGVTIGAFSSLTVSAKTPTSSARPFAGNYAGSITVTLTPAT